MEDADQFLTLHLWRNDMLQGLLNLLNKGIARVEEQQVLHPLLSESKEVKMRAGEDR